MSEIRRLVLDANVLLRAVLGARVFEVLKTYEGSVEFFAPAICFDDARRHHIDLSLRRGLDLRDGQRTFERIAEIVESIEDDFYLPQQMEAERRMLSRDVTDWPIVAAALFLDCPIWTEDRDFFGCGVATWMTSTVEIYLEA
jgi:predicted nucleic acid-binding protein